MDDDDFCFDLVDEVRDALADMSPEERLKIFKLVAKGYCTLCGGDSLPCFCGPEYDE